MSSTAGEEESVPLIDSDDGHLDLSQYLATRTGFLPIPVVITEPAVGYGGGLGLMFIHGQLGAKDGEERKGPPSITVLGGAYTESESWATGLGHFGSWYEDRLRYTGLLGKGVGNLEFFGIGDDPAGSLGENGLDFEIEGLFVRQQLLAKMSDTPLFVGLRYEIANTETKFDAGVPAIPQQAFDRQDASIAAVAQFDTRDTIFTPSRGANATLAAFHYDEWLGGDGEYNRLELRTPFWVPLDETLVLGVNPLLTLAGDDTPFYALPYVTLRGVPALRYQGDDAASLEAELRWNFVPRWSVIGFGGVGQAVESSAEFGGESYLVKAGGVGFRYMIARAFGLHVGLDVARGPEDTAVYIQVGSAWH
ncbi:MAG: glyceraldehyde-3-phosphate dehydrogenase [Planctomycetota bacterium]